MKQPNTFVYVAGPYRPKDGTHDWRGYFEIDAHISEARKWAAALAEAGIPFFCPHLNSAHFEIIVPKVPSQYWLDMDLVILRYASALLLLPGWKESRGTQEEKRQAHDQGKRVYTHRLFPQLVREWYEVQLPG